MMTPAAPAVLPSSRHLRVKPPCAELATGTPAETADDRQLREDIERALLTSGHRLLSAVTVSVRNYQVTLHGRVPRYYLRQLALAAVLTTPGVRGVRDDLAVTPPPRAGGSTPR